MSDEEIRDLLDLAVQEPDSDGPSAEHIWSAGRRQRNRGRAWLGGLGAAAAAASILGIVWAQGLAGGDAGPPPPADTPSGTTTEPMIELDHVAQGEPFFARFDRAGTEPTQELTGASVPTTLADLQGTWIGPEGEEFTFAGDQLDAVSSACRDNAGTIEVTPEGRLRAVGAWEATVAAGDCPQDDVMTAWGPALHQQPFVGLDGETLIISGLDGTVTEPRVRVALTLGEADEGSAGAWTDVPAATDVTSIALGPDFALMLPGSEGGAWRGAATVTLHEVPGIAAAAQDPDLEVSGYPSTCPLQLESSLRSDGVLLAGAAAPQPSCAEGSDSPLPPTDPSPAVVALLRSGPTVYVHDGTMIITGTIPESLLEPAPGVDDATREPTAEEPETPTSTLTIPNVLGSSVVVVLSEGTWEPSGVLTPLTAEEAHGGHWLPVDTTTLPPTVGDDVNGDRGLTYDGSTWRFRDCGIDVSVPGTLEDSLLVATGDPVVVPDPDPGAACVFPGLMPDEWASVLTSRPRLSTDGEILVLVGRTDDGPLEPVGMALLGEGVSDPSGGPTRAVTDEDLAAGLTEVPRPVAVDDIGVSDHLDLQPEHATSLSVQDGMVRLDVGCAEPLTGPAWFSPIGPDDRWQLTAALPHEPDCGTGLDQAAAGEAELWRQMLAQGAFLHHFGDYVIVDAMVDGVWAQADGS